MAQKKDILKKLAEPLKVEEVEFRIQSITKSGYATILAYKDARVDMNRLDDVCGENWQNKYELIDGQLFCSIGIKFEGEWIWRTDVGIESQTEKTKGRASDSFKRAGFRWGIGRELYDYPRIFLQLKGLKDVSGAEKPEFLEKKSGNKDIGTAGYGLQLNKWEWDISFKNGKVDRIIGKDYKGVIRFDSNKDWNGLPKGNQTPPPQQPKPEKTHKKKMSKAVFDKAMKSTKIDVLEQALSTYDLTTDQAGSISIRIEELKQ